MSKRRSKRKVRKERNLSEAIIGFSERYSTILAIIILIIIVVVGTYIRLLPAIKYKLELDANDPWIEYWVSKYLVTHGLFSWSGLKDVKTFWWPHGRDFLTSEYLGIPWISAATYPIAKHFGLTLREWVALIPVFAGSLAIIMIYFFVSYLLRSKLAGLIASALFAVMPGAVVRTTAGFVEKIGVAIPIIMFSYILFVAALRSKTGKRRAVASFFAGIVAGLVAWFWGGYDLETATFAVTVLIDLILYKPRISRITNLYLPLLIGYIITVSMSPAAGIHYFIKDVGLALEAAIVFYIIGIGFDRLLKGSTALFRLWLVIVLISLGGAFITSGALTLSGRILYALGIRSHVSPLETSIQEHSPASWSSIFIGYGIAVILGIGAVAIDLYKLYSYRGRWSELPPTYPFRLSVLLLFLFLVYVNKNMVYFEQMASFYATLASGFLVGLLVSEDAKKVVALRKQAKRSKVLKGYQNPLKDPLRLAGALTVILIVAGGSLIYAKQSYLRNEYHAPSILTSMLDALTIREGGGTKVVVPLNDAWINALKFINRSTPPNALIVSWWDYGYWITVNTNRRTVADGATLNGTQIRLLAQILTAPEHQASGLLKLLGAKPNNTYVVFYDVFRALKSAKGAVTIFPMTSFYPNPANRNMYFILYGSGDLAKSFQMLRIGYRIYPYAVTPFNTSWYATTMTMNGNTYFMFPGFIGDPPQTAEKVRSALIYKLTIYGLYHLLDHPVANSNCLSLFQNITSLSPTVPISQYNLARLPPVNVTDFKLVATALGCPLNTVVKTESGYTSFIVVVVFIYKWIG